MTAILSRASVLAIKVESTEGTPVAPAGATEFIALQEDFSIDPAIDVLENAELKSSIGKSQPILGSENPSASLSHYMRSSGVAGTAPNFGLLIKAALGGQSTAGTEYDTVSSSTVALLKVNTGEGAQFERGQAVLIKDGTNGYRIRCIDSISSDDLTMGFNVPVAPGSGVNLGKAVLYKPANSGHPTFSLWHYVGNGGAVQMMAGTRVTSMSFDISAGELINGKFSLEGVGYYFNPITLAATDIKIDWTDDTGDFAATVTAKTYKNPHDLASALQVAMAAANPLLSKTVTYSNTTGKFTIKSAGTVLSLLWNTGANTANTIGDKIGFVVASDDTGTAAATGYTSDNAISFAAPYTPSYDAADPLVAKYNECMIGDATDYACFEAESASIEVSTPKSNIPSVCAESGIAGSLINSREVTISVTGPLNQFDAGMINRLQVGSSTKFQYSFGQKSGGNWIAGKCGVFYGPTMTVTKCNVSDSDGRAVAEIELSCFVNSSGLGEFYINTL